MEETSSEPENTEKSVRSPFAGVHSAVQKKGGPKTPLRTGLGVLAALILIGGGFIVFRSFNDPLRALKAFPIEEYYNNHAAFEGTRFRAQLKSVNQLGWKEGVGRLVLFNFGDTEKPAVVLIPQNFETISFEPGEHYQAELLVGEGGLIKAALIRRN